MSDQPGLPPEPPPPDILMDLLFGTVLDPLLKLPILRAGIELQVWAEIAQGHQTANEIASAQGSDPGGMRLLLDALSLMKLLEKEAGGYHLPDWTEYYLLPGRPTYLGDFALEWLAWERHGQLAQAIRTGKRPIVPDVILKLLQREVDRGEAEAIGLAVQLNAEVLLIDERQARKLAQYLELNVVGLLDVLHEAKQRQLIPTIKPVLDDLLTRACFRLSHKLYQRTLHTAGE